MGPNFSDNSHKRETFFSVSWSTPGGVGEEVRGACWALSVLTNCPPVPEGQTWGKAENYEFSLSGKIIKLLRLNMKKEYFENNREPGIFTSVVLFSLRALPQNYGNSQLAHTQLLALPISPTPPLADPCFFRLVLTFWTCFLPGVSWHTRHLVSKYFCYMCLTIKHCA